MRLWREATPSQRLGFVAFVVICVGLLAVATAMARRPHYAVLYANLQQEDAAAVVKRLREMKVQYRVTAGTVEAPADQVDELRLDLAGSGIPTGGQTGFELFDKTRIGLSEFGEQLNYQRALQGELARTITHLDPVEQARVHVSIPRERLYENEQEKPTASVVLRLRGGGRLTSAQVGSIVHLVSGAVGGMTPEAVTVLDTQGRLLSSADDSAPGGGGITAASNQLQLRRDYERGVEQAVQSMLDRVVGEGKSMVRASASLDLERVESERETYQPAAQGEGVLLTKHETKESYKGLGEPGARGVPGISSNSVAAPVIGKTPPRADQYEHTESSTEYRVSRQVERTLRPPGQVKRLTVAVFVDEKAKVGKLDDLKAAVAAAVGLDPTRGDSVVVSLAPFEPAAPEDAGSRASAVREFYHNVGRDFAAIVLLGIFVRFASRMLRRRGPQAVPAPGTSSVDGSAPAAAPAVLGSVSAAPSFDPDRATEVLRGWLNSEPRARAADGNGKS